METDTFVDIDKIEIDKISKNLADLAATLEEPGEIASSKNMGRVEVY